KDFWEPKSSPPKLATALERELEAAGVDPDQVTLYASIEEAVRELVTEDPVAWAAGEEIQGVVERAEEALMSQLDRPSLEREIYDHVGRGTVAIMSPAQPTIVEP